MHERFLVIAGSYRPDYPRDATWREFFHSGDHSIRDVSHPVGYVNRWGKAPAGEWLKNVCVRYFAGLLAMPGLIGCLLNPHAQAIFIYRNNHLLLTALGLFRFLLRSRTPLIYDAWISLSLKAETTGQSRWIRWIIRNMEKTALGCADRTVVLSDAYADYYQSLLAGSSRFKPIVVPLTAGGMWENLPVQPKPKATGFVYWGTFLEQHGVELLLEDPVSGFPLVLCGEGKLLGALRARAKRANMDSIRFTGFLDEEALITLVDSATAAFGHLQPVHDYALVLPNKALQSFARGKCVIMVGGDLPEAWHSAVSGGAIQCFDGTAADLAEKMQALLDDPQRAHRYGECARAYYARRHSRAVAIEAMQRVISDSCRITR